jgi:O-antigen/teichoic acid export membrane protein
VRCAGLWRSRFVRGVSVLAGGAALAQSLNMLASPILTRLYSPADFGVLSQYMATLTILLIVVSLRFEIAIPLADDEDEAVHLVSFSLLLTTITCVIVTVVLLGLSRFPASLFGLRALGPYIFLLPLGLLGGGFYQTLSYWAVRQRWFPLIARTKVQQVCSALTIQMLMGALFRTGPLGLLLGGVANQTMGYSTFARRGHLLRRMREARVSRAALLGAARHHRRTAFWSSASGFVNTLALQLPFLLMASLFGLKASGCLLLSSRITTAGGDLISSTVAQTYYGEATTRYREDRSELKRLFAKAVRGLLLISLAVAIVVWMVAPTVVTVVFGSKWSDAGMFARYQSLVLLGSLVVSPVSTTVFILRKMHLQVIWDICRIGVVAACFFGAHSMQWNAVRAVGLYSVGSLATYTIWLGVLIALVSRASHEDRRGVAQPIQDNEDAGRMA